jgi:hypothetical protein
MQKSDYAHSAIATPDSSSSPNRPSQTKAMTWTGRVLSALPVLMLLFSSALKLSHAAPLVALWTNRFGYPESALVPIGLLEAACAIVFAVPRTSVLGAILITGYLGGAVATHVRVGDPFAIPVVLGALAWVGLYLRDERIRALIPLFSR